MASTEQLITHYQEQALACETARDQIKKNKALRDKGSELRKATTAYTLAARRWNDAARALAGAETLREVDDLVADAIAFHVKGNERRAALEGTTTAPAPAPEPYTVPLEPADTETIVITETIAVNNPDTDAAQYLYSTGVTADGRHVDISEDADGTDTPTIGVHPSAASAREEMMATVVDQLLDRIPYRPELGAVFLGWGDRHRVSAVPHTGQTWRSAIRDGNKTTFTDHPSRAEALQAALGSAEQIAGRLMESSDRVQELGGLWLARRTAEARAEEYQARFVERLRQAKADRVVDRYGQVSNDEFARMAGVSVQAVNKML
jgi:hypothetical protein